MRLDLATAGDPSWVGGNGRFPVKLIYTWRGTVVGEGWLLGAQQEVPQSALRHVAELRAAEQLRPVLAPRGQLPNPPVSVIVCTLNRSDDLRRCLTSLKYLRSPAHEIIVVNNDPRDQDTSQVALAFGARVVDEPQRGLASARNTGLRAATGELVAFIDDDCVADPGWLDGLAAAFDHPLIVGCVGYVGPAEMESEAQLLWELQGGFVDPLAEYVADGASGGPWAAFGLGDGNVILRRAAFQRYGGFLEDLGPGTPARSAQDAEFFHRLMSRGLRVRFSTARVVWHRHRREVAELAETLEGYMTGLSAHAARQLVHRHDLDALNLWRWAGPFLWALARSAIRDPRPARRILLVAQARGILAGPWRDRHALVRPAPPPVIHAPDATGVDPVQASIMCELPAVSVLIASRNRRDRLMEAVRAIADQDCPMTALELIVALDGSTDGSGEALRTLDLPFPLHVADQTPAGLAASRNVGVRRSRNPLVLILDDDIIASSGLVTAHRLAHAARSAAIVMGRHPPVIDETSWWAQIVRAGREDRFARLQHPGWKPSFVDYADGNSSLLRQTFDRVGGFDEAFNADHRHDWEFAIRATANGVSMVYEPGALGDHHPNASFAASLRVARQEGLSDVALVRKHPQVAGRLPLGQPRRDRSRRRITDRIAGYLSDEQWCAVARQCEQIGARRSWLRVVLAATAEAYDSGVRAAIDQNELDALLLPVARGEDVVTVQIDPERSAAIARNIAAHQGRVVLSMSGAAFEATKPGETWDAEEVLRLAASRVADVMGAGRLGCGKE